MGEFVCWVRVLGYGVLVLVGCGLSLLFCFLICGLLLGYGYLVWSCCVFSALAWFVCLDCLLLWFGLFVY